jgi:hypothetical protein
MLRARVRSRVSVLVDGELLGRAGLGDGEDHQASLMTVISIGGRQIGKSTSTKLLIKHLLNGKLLLPENIFYDRKSFATVLDGTQMKPRCDPRLTVNDPATSLRGTGQRLGVIPGRDLLHAAEVIAILGSATAPTPRSRRQVPLARWSQRIDQGSRHDILVVGSGLG